jgi:hypothetical protein
MEYDVCPCVYLFIFDVYYKSLVWFEWPHFNQHMIFVLDWELHKLNDIACGVDRT